MDPVTKSQKKKNKKILKEQSMELLNLFKLESYAACLDRIEEIGGNAMRSLSIYETAIRCNYMTERYDVALALIGDHNLHGHTTKSFRILLIEASCNIQLSKFMEAYKMYKDLLDHTDIDDEDRETCMLAMKECLGKKPDIEESLKRIAEQIAEQHADELLHEIDAQKSCSSSTVKSSSKGYEDIKPVASSNVDPPVVVDEPVASSSGTLSRTTSAVIQGVEVIKPSSSSGNVDPLVVDAESKLVASSSGTSYQKTPSKSVKFQEVFSFEIDEPYCEMVIGPLTFQKTFISIKESVDIPTYVEDLSDMKGASFLLKPQFIVRQSYVVERVHSIKVFFQRKKDEFTGKNEEEWWEFICDNFMTIFRGIICGLYAIHSAKRICGDLENSMYVTDKGKGRVFYARGESFTDHGAQKDLNELLSTMESIVTLFKPRCRPADPQDWRKELVDTYKLPSDVYHFFVSLKDKQGANFKIQTTWLIDHPAFWPLEHKLNFFRVLNDVLRDGFICDQSFNSLLLYCGDFMDWKTNVTNDGLLNAIYLYKGERVYNNGSQEKIIHFILAVINHVNDRDYGRHRGGNKLTRADIASLIEIVCPTIHTALYDIICDHAKNLYNFAYEREQLEEAQEHLSSLRSDLL